MPRTRIHSQKQNIGGIVNNRDFGSESQLSDGLNLEGDLLGTVRHRRALSEFSAAEYTAYLGSEPTSPIITGADITAPDGTTLVGIVTLS